MNIVYSERKQYQKLKYNRYIKKSVVMETVTGWTFLSPLLIVALIFSTSAIAIGLYLTFNEGMTFSNLRWVGIHNWKNVFSNPALHLDVAFKNTLLYAVVSVPIIIVTALIVSGILNAKWLKGKRAFLAIFFLPQVTSAIASTIIFKQIFGPNGAVTINYNANPQLVIWVVIISAIWGGVAGTLITFNTAFATIDKTQYEAADLDGASGLQKFARITIPSIGPIIAYSMVMGVIGGFGVFDGPYLFAKTANVDGDKVATLIFKGFNYIMPVKADAYPSVGLGSTILFMTALIIAGFTIIANLFFPMNKKTN